MLRLAETCGEDSVLHQSHWIDDRGYLVLHHPPPRQLPSLWPANDDVELLLKHGNESLLGQDQQLGHEHAAQSILGLARRFSH